MNFIKRFFFKRAVSKTLEAAKTQSELEKSLDIILKETQTEYTRALREAEKQNRIREMQRRTQDLKRSTREDFSDDEEDFDDDEEGGFEDLIVKNLTKGLQEKFLSGVKSPALTGVVQPEPPLMSGENTPLSFNMDKFNSLPPEEKEIITQIARKKGLID